jgi:hypothetical protein
LGEAAQAAQTTFTAAAIDRHVSDAGDEVT